MLISFIVAIYNVDKYLRDCIDSILCQDLESFEVILVNDGSTDNSREICDIYKRNNPHIKVIHQQNQGVSNARNSGIRVARGEWLVFIDGDDMLPVNYSQNISLDILKSNNFDIIVFSYMQLLKNNQIIPWGKQAINDDDGQIEIFEGNTLDEIRYNCLFHPYYKKKEFYEDFGYPWAKMYRKRLIYENCIRFPHDVVLHEDTLFNIIALKYANRVLGIHKIMYYYRQHNMSITNQAINDYENIIIHKLKKQNEIINCLYSQSTNMKKRHYANCLMFEIWIAERKKNLPESYIFFKSACKDPLFNICVINTDKKLVGLLMHLYAILLNNHLFLLAAILSRCFHFKIKC